MEPVNLVLLGEGRWLTGDASARASEEIGMQLDPMQARLGELLRRLESQESGLFKQHKFLSTKTHKKLLGGQLKQQNHSNNLTMRGEMGMISGLVKAGIKAGTGRMRLGTIPSQRTIPRLCQRGVETRNTLMTELTKEARIQVIIASLFLG